MLNRRRTCLLLLSLQLAWLTVYAARAQVGAVQPAGAGQPIVSSNSSELRPLPDIPTLMHEVENHQRLAEAVEKEYTYRTDTRLERLDKHGEIKSVDTRVTSVFFLQGIPVQKTLEHNGKPLSPAEQKKEDESIDREVEHAKARLAKAASTGKPTDASGNDVVTVSRLLELGQFTNPRRVKIAGRDTIAIDFAGDPNAKTHNAAETVLHDMAGTLWIDEQDRALQHLEGRFVNTFKIGGGILADISKGTSFTASNVRINNEVWLPADIEAHGHIRFLVFFNIDGNFSLRTSDYRKFQVTSTILPAGTLESDPH